MTATAEPRPERRPPKPVKQHHHSDAEHITAAQRAAQAWSQRGEQSPRDPHVAAQAVVTQLHILARGDRQRAAQLARVIAQARATAIENRRLVLAHADLARQLAQVGYRKPERWGGYIPPDDGPSAARDILKRLVAEARRRERAR